MTTLIDGKAIAQLSAPRSRGGRGAGRGRATTPGLATVLVGDDPASAVYVNGKQKAAPRPASRASTAACRRPPGSEVRALLHELTPTRRSTASCCSCPAAAHRRPAADRHPPAKDVDGLTPISTGTSTRACPGLSPCTPLGCMQLLRRDDADLHGAAAVVVGRSVLVGKLISRAAPAANATVTTVPREDAGPRRSAARRHPDRRRRPPRPVQGRLGHGGAVVLDVGINRPSTAKLTGDANRSHRARARP